MLKSMKLLRISLVAVFVVAVFVSVGLVSALNQNDASAQVFWGGSDPILPGDMVLARINFTNYLSQPLQIQAIGLNFDWQNETQFYGHDLSTSPQTVAASGSYLCDPIIIQVPYTVSLGPHNYNVGVDGLDASGTAFSWDGPTTSIVIGASTQGTPTPSSSTNPGGGGQTGSPQNWTIYIIAAIAVVAIIIAVIFLFMEIRKRPKKPAQKAEKQAPEAEKQAPEAEKQAPEAEKPKPASEQPPESFEGGGI
jgi:flagellar basal body-associated protein FliL